MSRAWVDIIRESKSCRLHVPKRLRRRGKLQIMIAPQNVCYWPLADITEAPLVTSLFWSLFWGKISRRFVTYFTNGIRRSS
jgi:hypothetical protein